VFNIFNLIRNKREICVPASRVNISNCWNWNTSYE